jgi:hypothetical protein
MNMTGMFMEGGLASRQSVLGPSRGIVSMISVPSSSVMAWGQELAWDKFKLLAWEAIYPSVKRQPISQPSSFIWFYRKSLSNLSDGMWDEVLPADGCGYIAFVAYRIGADEQEHGVLARIKDYKMFRAMRGDERYHGYRNIHEYVRGIKAIDIPTPV